MLVEEEKIVDRNEPSILESMLDLVSHSDAEKKATYKICVDGKKINPCSKGEVNLWGYEENPTYQEKKQRLNEEVSFFHNAISNLEKLGNFAKTSTNDCDDTDNEFITYNCRNSVTLLSGRIKDLRQMKLKKEIFCAS